MKNLPLILCLWLILPAVFAQTTQDKQDQNNMILWSAQEKYRTLREVNPVFDRLVQIDKWTTWQETGRIKLNFNTHHTQGMLKIGDYYYMSTVEVIRWPKRPDKGEGIGHLYKFDSHGNLVDSVHMGYGDVYHPGGIDFDGRHIWVPVTEYLPHSFSVIYKVDPQTMTAEKVFEYEDSIGAIVCNTEDNTLVGANWDARLFHRWIMDENGKVLNADVPRELLGIPNPSSFIAAQDCKYLGNNLMFCSGLQSYFEKDIRVRVGGFEIIDLQDFRMVHQIPLSLFTPSGQLMTNNPCTLEATEKGLRAYFVPEDNDSYLYIYETGLDADQH